MQTLGAKFPLRKIDTGPLRFAIDMRANSLYTHMEVTGSRFTDADDKVIELSTPKYAEKAIVTPEGYLHFHPNEVYAQFKDLPNDTSKPGRAAFRDPLKKAEDRDMNTIVDPRRFFHVSSLLSVWEHLDLTAKGLQADKPDLRDAFDKAVTVQKAEGESGPMFSVTCSAPGPGKNVVSQNWRFDARTGMNLTDVYEESAGQTKLHTWRDYKVVDGIFVPWKFRFASTAPDGQHIAFERLVELTECKLNRSILASAFTYEGFGLEDGERVVDRIEGVVYVWERGKPVKLGDFGEQQPPASVDATGGGGRRILIAAGIASIIVLAFLSWRRRKTSSAPRGA